MPKIGTSDFVFKQLGDLVNYFIVNYFIYEKPKPEPQARPEFDFEGKSVDVLDLISVEESEIKECRNCFHYKPCVDFEIYRTMPNKKRKMYRHLYSTCALTREFTNSMRAGKCTNLQLFKPKEIPHKSIADILEFDK